MPKIAMALLSLTIATSAAGDEPPIQVTEHVACGWKTNDNGVDYHSCWFTT